MPHPPALPLYPETSAERDRWILERRGAREPVDPEQPYAYLVETERGDDGRPAPVATLFLTNRECPWRCLMCDLWRHTLAGDTPAGAIPRQIRYALQRLPPAYAVKLYNSGSFFDPRAIPPADDDSIAREVAGFRRVIVESHPSLVGARCFAFADRLEGTLEVAMGLESVHPAALQTLNKGMSLAQYAAAARQLLRHGLALRSFVLVGAPFVPHREAALWIQRSISFALECGASAVSLIPVRQGNGALDALAAAGAFREPVLAELEDALDFGLSLRGGRVFADLWDLDRFAPCSPCRVQRVARLRRINLSQSPEPRVLCAACGVGGR